MDVSEERIASIFRIEEQANKTTSIKQSAYSSIPSMETVGSAETSVNFFETVRRTFEADSIVYSHCCENFKSNDFRVT
jgi:hypothetical protein